MPCNIGVALFDFSVAVDSAGNAFNFSSLKDLSDECIWIIDQDDNYVDRYLAGRGRFKSDMFFGRKLKTIVTDLGIQNLTPNEQAQVLQTIFAWTVDSSQNYTGQISRIQNRLAIYPKIENRQKHFKPIIESASQRYCNLAPFGSMGTPFVLFKPASLAYQELATAKFPLTNFRGLNAQQIDPQELKENSEAAAFVKISNADHVAAISSLDLWSMEQRVKEGALWLSGAEYNHLSETLGFDPRIDEGLAALQWSSLSERYPLLVHSAAEAESKKTALKEEMAYSLFLIYEAMLASHLGLGTRRVNFSEIYLASISRLKSLPQVSALCANGFDIQGYGAGRIALQEHPMKFTDERRKQFLELVFSLGLFTPATDFGVDFGDRSDSGFGTYFTYAVTGDSNSLCQLNHYILES